VSPDSDFGADIAVMVAGIMNTTTAVMTYGADGTLLSAVVALAAWQGSLRRPRGKHHRERGWSWPGQAEGPDLD